jgi:hypothetical protein
VKDLVGQRQGQLGGAADRRDVDPDEAVRPGAGELTRGIDRQRVALRVVAVLAEYGVDRVAGDDRQPQLRLPGHLRALAGGPQARFRGQRRGWMKARIAEGGAVGLAPGGEAKPGQDGGPQSGGEPGEVGQRPSGRQRAGRDVRRRPGRRMNARQRAVGERERLKRCLLGHRPVGSDLGQDPVIGGAGQHGAQPRVGDRGQLLGLLHSCARPREANTKHAHPRALPPSQREPLTAANPARLDRSVAAQRQTGAAVCSSPGGQHAVGNRL